MSNGKCVLSVVLAVVVCRYALSADLAELAKEYRSVDGALVLELSNLQSADPAGVEVLVELVSMDVEM